MEPAPVMAVPGATPRLPVRVVAPVFVTVEAARTAKPRAEPKTDVAGEAAQSSAAENQRRRR